MSTIGKVAAVFTASTSGLTSGVRASITAFRQLGGEASTLKSVFDRLRGIGSMGFDAIGPAADVARDKLAQFERLVSLAGDALKRGSIDTEAFAKKLNLIGAAAATLDAELGRAVALTEQYRTAEERSAAAIAEANNLLSKKLITQQTHAAVMREATGAAAEEQRAAADTAAEMERLSKVFAEGASVTKSVATAEERHAETMARLYQLLDAGAISQETFARASERSAGELRAASASAGRFTNATEAASNGAAALARRLNALIAIEGARLFASVTAAVGRATSAMVDMAQSQVGVIETQSRMADRLGMTYAEIDGLATAGEMAGLSFDAMGGAVQRAEITFAKAAQGSTAAREAFSRLGISIEDLNLQSPAQRFRTIADSIAQLPTEAERAAAAVAFFGRSGADLVPLFSRGAGAIKEATDNAQRFGRSLSNAQTTNVSAMTDAFTNVSKAINGVVQQVVAFLAPSITAIATEFTNFVGSIGGANIGQSIGEGILAGARYLAEIGDYLISGIPAAWEYVKGVGDYWGTVFEIGRRVFDFFAAVGRALEGYFKLGGSLLLGLIGRLMNAAGELAQLASFGSVGGDIEKAGERLMATSTTLWNESGQAFMAYAENAGNVIFGRSEEAGEAIAGPLVSGLDRAREQARQSAQAISQAAAKPIDIRQTATIEPISQAALAPLKQAVEGINSRSAEGLRTMFRIMRGDTGNDPQERIARATERTATAVENLGDDGGFGDFDVINLAPAAGA